MATDPTNDLSINRNKIILVGAVVAIVLIVIAFFVSNDRQGTADQNRAPLIAYLAPDDNGLWQLFVAEADGSEATRLTKPIKIYTFSVAPDGDAIVYALPDKNGGSAVWLVDPGIRPNLKSSSPALMNCAPIQSGHLPVTRCSSNAPNPMHHKRPVCGG